MIVGDRHTILTYVLTYIKAATCINFNGPAGRADIEHVLSNPMLINTTGTHNKDKVSNIAMPFQQRSDKKCRFAEKGRYTVNRKRTSDE